MKLNSKIYPGKAKAGEHKVPLPTFQMCLFKL